jgi:Predicted periplasmic/secreted protein
MNEVNTANVVKGALAGLIGGLIASFVMEQFQSLVMSASQSEKKQEKQEGKKEEPANEKAAMAVSENVFDHYLTKEEKSTAGEAMHYAMGGTSGMIFGAASELMPETAIGAGLPFGTAVWLVADDLIVPALGLSKPVSDVPLSQHAYALSSHLVYGLTTDIVRRGIRYLW